MSGSFSLWDFSDSPTPVVGVFRSDSGPGGLVIGSAFDDYIQGRSNTSVRGGAGNDLIILYGPSHYADGGPGADNIHLSRDPLTHSTVHVASISDLTDGVQWDTIHQFSKNDTVDLGDIDANSNLDGNQAFTWMGTAKFDGHAGELRYTHSDHHGHPSLVVEGDVNGDGVADFHFVIMGHQHLYADNFVL